MLHETIRNTALKLIVTTLFRMVTTLFQQSPLQIVPGNNNFNGVLSRRVEGFSLTGPSEKAKKTVEGSIEDVFAPGSVKTD